MAILEQDKVFYSEESNGDKTIYLPITRANNVEGLGRSANTTYSVGDVVYADTNKAIALKCTTAGTTSANELDISANSVGDTVTDGGVVWSVVKRDLSADFKDLEANLLPVGTIISYAGNATPNGFLDCSGASLNPTTYANLFGVIGTTYGGDGSTTFNLPNMGSKILTDNLTLTGNAQVVSAYDGGLYYLFGYEGNAFGSYGIRIGFYNGTSGYGDISGVTAGGGFTPGNNLISCMVAKMSDVSVNTKSVTVKYCIKY